MYQSLLSTARAYPRATFMRKGTAQAFSPTQISLGEGFTSVGRLYHWTLPMGCGDGDLRAPSPNRASAHTPTWLSLSSSSLSPRLPLHDKAHTPQIGCCCLKRPDHNLAFLLDLSSHKTLPIQTSIHTFCLQSKAALILSLYRVGSLDSSYSWHFSLQFPRGYGHPYASASLVVWYDKSEAKQA